MDKSGGFLNYVRRVVKPFPQWTDVSEWFLRPDGTVPRLSKHYQLVEGIGCLLRKKNGRYLVTMQPGRSEVKTKQVQQFITPPHGDF